MSKKNHLAAYRSPWVVHYNASSCNGCDLEVLDSMLPAYDIERFGAINIGNPKHADILLVTGGVNPQTKPALLQVYSQMTEPRVVVAVGICACNGGVFKDGYSILGGVDQVIPVDFYVPGCAAKPDSIVKALGKAVKLLEKKAEALRKGKLMTAREQHADDPPFYDKPLPDRSAGEPHHYEYFDDDDREVAPADLAGGAQAEHGDDGLDPGLSGGSDETAEGGLDAPVAVASAAHDEAWPADAEPQQAPDRSASAYHQVLDHHLEQASRLDAGWPAHVETSAGSYVQGYAAHHEGQEGTAMAAVGEPGAEPIAVPAAAGEPEAEQVSIDVDPGYPVKLQDPAAYQRMTGEGSDEDV